MNPLHEAIADFLSGVRSDETDRVRAAVRAPGTNKEIDAALADYHVQFASPKPPPGVRAAAARVKARESWLAVYDRLVTRCQESLVDTSDTRSRTTAETEVSTVISTHVESAADRKWENLKNRRLLWPLILEMTSRRMGKELSMTLAAGEEFADELRESIQQSFGKAHDKRHKEILRATLHGRSAREIADRTKDDTADVELAIEALHDRLSELLSA